MTDDRLSKPFETLRVSFPAEWVLHVELARSRQLNSMTSLFFVEMTEAFEAVRRSSAIRAVVVSGGDARMFTAGLDLKETGGFPQPDADPARMAHGFINKVQALQKSFSVIEDCGKPVIVAVHGMCVGGGIDLIAACDIRFCTKDAAFTVKEVDVGIAADLGTLQRLPKVVGNDSWVRDVCFTGRIFLPPRRFSLASLALACLDGSHLAADEALATAKFIASKAPLAVHGIKTLLNYSREHTTKDSLEYTALWNSVMMNSPDTILAAQAAMTRKPAVFPKL
ncbi:enoyl-CoA hydratase/isomerase [Entophlyctis helioformis]|nr:enoyl-CoA hydratase/isomerase [Entophlyctis helioformis]